MTDLDVVIVNWNAGTLLRDCLAGIAASEGAERIAVTVVDNASTDASHEGLLALPGPFRLIRNGDNLGFGRACNQGAAAGSAPAILFLNPDARVEPDTLIRARAALFAEPRRGIVGARLREPDGTTARSCARAPTPAGMLGRAFALDRLGLARPHFLLEWDHEADRPVDQVMGAFLMIRRDLFAALAGFDERFFVYYEDVDLCLRARQAGYAVLHLAGPSARHLGQGTTRQAKARRLFYILRSEILYAAKHHGRVLALALTASAFCAQIPMRLTQALMRRSPAEAREVLRAAGLLAAALPEIASRLRAKPAPSPAPPAGSGERA